jgi:hypothetical protein
MEIDLVRAVFGWMSVLNLGYLLLATVFVKVFPSWILALHKSWFGVDEADLRRAYFNFVSQYKVMTLIFSVVPYLALRLVA